MTDSSVDQLNQCLHCFSVQSNQDHLNWVSNKPQWRFIWPSDESSHSQQKAKSCTTLPTLSRREEGRTDPLAALLAHCRPADNCLPQDDLPYTLLRRNTWITRSRSVASVGLLGRSSACPRCSSRSFPIAWQTPRAAFIQDSQILNVSYTQGPLLWIVWNTSIILQATKKCAL